MLNIISKNRILRNVEKVFSDKYVIRSNKEWLEEFNKLKEDEKLELIDLVERIQSLTIVKGFTRLDPKIRVPAFGNFHIKDIRRVFIENKELKESSHENREDFMRTKFQYKPSNNHVKKTTFSTINTKK